MARNTWWGKTLRFITLIVFLLFRLPKVRQGVDFATSGPDEGTGHLAAAVSLLLTGILTLTVQYWPGPSHTWDETNWAAAFLITSSMLGLGQVLGGAALLFLREKAKITASRQIVQN